MTIRNLFKDLQYVGKAEGDKRAYHVFSGSDAFLVVAPSTRGGLNVNVVDRRAAEVIRRRFRRKRVTVKELIKGARRPDLFGDRFAALNALYVMVALTQARKLAERDGRAMVFKMN